jgi:hypothetical protein
LIWECYAQNLTTQGQFISESEEGSAFANGGLCGVLGNGGANAKPLQIFTFLLLPWSNATHLSVFITGVGVINEIVVEPRATL